jgi:hypothetical protein
VHYPTPRGIIEVRWERQGREGIDLRVRLPKRVTGRLDVPGLPKKTLTGGKHEFATG